MGDNFDQNYFEEFLQDSVRDQRMYPKDAVWRAINKKLHGDKRWPGLTIGAIILTAVTILICAHFSPKADIFSLNPQLKPIAAATKAQPSGNNSSNTPFYQLGSATASVLKSNRSVDQITLADNSKTVNAASHNDRDMTASAPLTEKVLAVSNRIFTATEQTTTPAELTFNEGKAEAIESSEGVTKAYDFNVTGVPQHSLFVPKIKVKTRLAKLETSANADKNEEVETAAHDEKFVRPVPKESKLSVAFYAAPSISYRKLREDNNGTKSTTEGPIEINNVADVNDVVRHKPATGFEAGVNLLYDLGGRLKIKSGLQYNVRQYRIDAYQSNTEVTSIELVQSNRIDTLNSITYFRNSNGINSAQLVNKYHQISIPVGVEWEVIGNKRIQFSLAGSIQPTYLINRNAYLLSTNFKNYTENEDMVRKWNINSNIEAFISFVVGDFKWQLGPQIRYQPYSTFIKEYSIKEHLVDYGIKLGVSTKLR